MNPVVIQMLSRYPLTTDSQRLRALREVVQEIGLAGLYRAGFFNEAAFYGGTCLRIFHHLPRFSEDLDFSLLKSNPGLDMSPYLQTLSEEFASLGIKVEMKLKKKAIQTAITSVFLKTSTMIMQLDVATNKPVKIKFEVDTDPPLGFATEEKLLLQPFSAYVKCFILADLFAGKMHALLFRQWQQRVKGRDWFDLVWYVQQSIPLHLAHLARRAIQSGHWPAERPFDVKSAQTLLQERISRLDIDQARADIERFLPSDSNIGPWSREYFQQVAERVRYK